MNDRTKWENAHFEHDAHPVDGIMSKPAAAPVVDGRDVRSAIAGIEGSVAVGSDGEWVSVRRTARDAAVTALRNLSSDCAHIYAAYAEAKASTPAAPGFDLEQFREAVVFWRDCAVREFRYGTASEADALLALIDASPKGGSCTTCNDNGLIGGPSFYQPDEGGVPCPDCATNAGVADTQRLDWLESEIRHYGDGQTEPREAYIGFNWQQGNGVKVFPGLRAAIDAEMQATSHGAGVSE